MTDENRDRNDHDLPTTSQPLHGEKRSAWKPLLVTLLVIGALVLIYLFGLTVLVPSD